MEIRQIKYMVAVAKYLNFSKAANACFISQPTISQQIINLEKELGVKLFERKGHSLILTSKGKDFLSYAEQILEKVSCLEQKMQEQEPLHGRIRIGTLPTSGSLYLISRICAFYNLYPKVHAQVSEAGGNELIKLLLSDQLDIAFLLPRFEDYALKEIKFYPVEEGNVVAMMADSHPLAEKKQILIKDLASERLIFPPPTHSLHQLLWKACRHESFEPNVVCECSKVETILEFAAHNFGIGFASSQVTGSLTRPHTVIRDLTPLILRTSCLAVLQHSLSSPAIAAFLRFVLHRSHSLG